MSGVQRALMAIGVVHALGCASGDAAQFVPWPEDLVLGWLCAIDVSGALSDCQKTSGTSAERIEEGQHLLIAFSLEQLRQIEPRADLSRLDAFALSDTSPERFDEALCRRYGYQETDGRIAHALDASEAAYSVYELGTASGGLTALRFEDRPRALRTLSVSMPVRHCLEGYRIDLNLFAEAQLSELRLLRERPIFMDENHLLLWNTTRLAVVERESNRATWLSEVSETGIKDLLPAAPAWKLGDVALETDRGDGSPRRGIASVYPDDTSMRGTHALVEFELPAAGGLRAKRLLALATDVGTSLSVVIEPNGGYVAVSNGMVATSSSVDVAPSIWALDGLSAQSLSLTGDALYPHVMRGGHSSIGDVVVADLHDRARAQLVHSPLAGSPTSLVARRDEEGRSWLHAASASQSARWLVGSAEFEAIPLWVPPEAVSCAGAELECGRARLTGGASVWTNLATQVGVVETEGGVVQLFAATYCTALFAMSVSEGCSIAVNSRDTAITFDSDLITWQAAQNGDRWLFGAWGQSLVYLAELGLVPEE